MSRGNTALAIGLAGMLAACASSTAASPTTGNSGGTTTGVSIPIAVSTVALLSQNGLCPDPPLQVAIDGNDNIYAVNSSLNLVQEDGGVSNLLSSVTGIVAVAASNAGVFIAEGSPGPIAIYDYGTSKQELVTGGASGCLDGSSADAGVGFAWGRALAVDNFGNIYVADWNGPGCTRIRRIQGLTGATGTLAGTGTPGYANGAGIDAAFNQPSGITVDVNKNVYVADSANNRIRVIDRNNNTRTLAGNGDAGFDDNDGPADTPTSPTFNYPTGLATDSSGNVYVADTFNNAIRRISASGDTTTLAGDGKPGFVNGTLGQSGTSQFNYPLSVAVDSKGNVYVADEGNCAIRRIDPSAK